MTKLYKSSAILVLYVRKEDGKGFRLSFDPLTGGGSQFVTSDEKLQKALDSHYDYGKKFYGVEIKEEPKPEPVATEAENKGPKQITVANLDDAKEYLAERFGISRAKMRSKAAIIAAAEENGIEFIGL